jgi:hypothetical protein
VRVHVGFAAEVLDDVDACLFVGVELNPDVALVRRSVR